MDPRAQLAVDRHWVEYKRGGAYSHSSAQWQLASQEVSREISISVWERRNETCNRTHPSPLTTGGEAVTVSKLVHTHDPALSIHSPLPAICCPPSALTVRARGSGARGHRRATKGQALFNAKQNSPLSLFHTHSIICQAMSNNIKQNHERSANETQRNSRTRGCIWEVYQT